MKRLRSLLVAAIVVAVVAFGVFNLRRETHLHNLIESSAAYLDSVQAFNKSAYRLGQYAHYDYDQRRGTLLFSDSARTPRVIARIQMVGDVSLRTQSWLWSWANPTIESPLADAARIVRAYGEAHHLKPLCDSVWRADEHDGWQMTAITAKLTRARGAYRSPSDSGPLFMVLTDIRWVTAADSVAHSCDTGCFAIPPRKPPAP